MNLLAFDLYPTLRLLLPIALLAGCALLWRKPRADAAFALLLAVNLAAWAGYLLPLQRSYGLERHTDRAFNLGMAACTAAGNSPLEHTQVGLASLEPFWNLAVAALAGFRPENVAFAYDLLSLIALLAVAAALFFGLRRAVDDAWERFLVVFCVLGLASAAMDYERGPILWRLFLLKPNHMLGLALLACILGMVARKSPAWRLLLVLGLLGWVFPIHWALACAGLVAAAAFGAIDRRSLAIAVVGSAVLAAPDLIHLARGYNPLGGGIAAEKMWTGHALGQESAHPLWATFNTGLLFTLGVAGIAIRWRRRDALDRPLRGFLCAAWALWAFYMLAPLTGIAPEADEMHAQLRFLMAIAGGAALAALARLLGPALELRPGQAPLLVLAALQPLAFWAWWNPPTTDRYHESNMTAVPAEVLEYGRWVRENTRPETIFLAGPDASSWIPVLAGRRVLLAEAKRPPADYEERRHVERRILEARDREAIQQAAARYDITYVALDGPWPGKPNRPIPPAQPAAFEPVFENAAVRILRIRD